MTPEETAKAGNAKLLDEWKEDGWWPVIEELDKNLSLVVPGYRILQIKEKFFGLRYYIDTTRGDHSPYALSRASELVREAELKAGDWRAANGRLIPEDPF